MLRVSDGKKKPLQNSSSSSGATTHEALPSATAVTAPLRTQCTSLMDPTWRRGPKGGGHA
jgi:hypothetical protein